MRARTIRTFLATAIFALASCLSAVAPAFAAERCDTSCGRVLSIRHVEQKGESSGVGAVAGGVLGGVLGHQLGSGRGNTAATVVGAAGGAYAGNEVEKNRKAKNYWSVQVKLDSGATRTLTFNSIPSVREGERVKLIDGGRRLALLQ